MLDLNNSCTTLMEYHRKYNTANTIHNTYTVNLIQQTKSTIQHKTYEGLNALAVVQTLSTTYMHMAQCIVSSTKKCITHNI